MTEQRENGESQSPDDRNGCEKLRQDELIKDLIPDPTALPDVRVLTGFVGRSPREGYWRLYFTLELNSYVEFPAGAVLCSKSLRTALNPLGGTTVWIDRDAKLQLVRVAQIRADDELEAEFNVPPVVMQNTCSSDDDCGKGQKCLGHWCSP
jgi:hypothetical protein